MERITTVAGLKSAIQILEVEQNARERLLKEQVGLVYESLKPINIIKRTLSELFSPTHLNGNLAGTALSITSGVLLNRFFIGSSGGIIKKLLGKVIQFGITKLTARKTEVITSAGFTVLSRFLMNRGWNSKARGN
jgi:hypothetical protein